MFTCFSHVSLNDCNHSRTACCFAGCQSGFHSQTAVCNEKYKDEIVSVFTSVVSGLKAIVLPTVVPFLSGTSVPGVIAPQNSTRAHFPPVRVDDPDHKDNFCTDVQSLNIYLSIKKRNSIHLCKEIKVSCSEYPCWNSLPDHFKS